MLCTLAGLITVVAAAAYIPAGALAASAAQWRSRSIYQIVTDRFATSDLSGPPCDTTQRRYCNGTWTGIQKKLDYIQNMGFDAIWISPIVQNIANVTAYGEAYHGYWSQDLTTLNPHFGDDSSLQALVAALHARGMYILLDVVVNHMAASTLPPPIPSYTPFNQPEEYHPFCFIQDYNNQTDVEQCWLGDSSVPLPDLNTEDDTVVQGMYTWINSTVQKYKIDGLRLDTVKHVRKDFWPGFAQSAGVWTVGEVLDSRTSYVGDYTNYIDSVLDYPAYFALTAAFSSSSGNISALAQVIRDTQSYKNGGFSTAAFLENHDQPRFQSTTTDLALVKNAIAYTFVADGVPIAYYGMEQGYAGGADPANREALWLSGYETTNKPLMQHITTLNRARKAASASSASFLSTPMTILTTTSTTTLALSKPPLLALLTNAGSSAPPQTETVPSTSTSTSPSTSTTQQGTGYTAHEALIDVLSCTQLQADANGDVSVQMASGQPMVILPRAALAGSGLCGGAKTSGARGRVRVYFGSTGVPAALVLLFATAAAVAVAAV